MIFTGGTNQVRPRVSRRVISLFIVACFRQWCGNRFGVRGPGSGVRDRLSAGPRTANPEPMPSLQPDGEGFEIVVGMLRVEGDAVDEGLGGIAQVIVGGQVLG